jgi:hypothetical protein
MKKICLLTLFLFLLFTGCKEYSTENICGIYVVQLQDEFATTNDTLIISKRNEGGGFEITRKILSQYFKKNKKPFYKVNHWTGNFNATDKSLLINNNGRILFFYPERNELQSGTIIFKKM